MNVWVEVEELNIEDRIEVLIQALLIINKTHGDMVTLAVMEALGEFKGC